MHPNPQWPKGYSNGSQQGNLLYGVEYENQGSSVGNRNHDKDAACVVCQDPSVSNVYVQWGRTSCSNGHKTEYNGVLLQKGWHFSAHEQWKLLMLPYLDLPRTREIMTNVEVARTRWSQGWPASQPPHSCRRMLMPAAIAHLRRPSNCLLIIHALPVPPPPPRLAPQIHDSVPVGCGLGNSTRSVAIPLVRQPRQKVGHADHGGDD